ncbi:HEAT repeat domain-containing protein [Rubinisphaera margarita]|uniref:HEAT repeat domain-containing protein n=1 Tax=Rubinisphaera margarita TaxID=2909586 RepID=UPI001EE94709|nr:HEAT repeat domain-containing protein [Rubinisphaera margarita]MCG6156913.1 hypothetical protein [Rubinisphaera margarita]
MWKPTKNLWARLVKLFYPIRDSESDQETAQRKRYILTALERARNVADLPGVSLYLDDADSGVRSKARSAAHRVIRGATWQDLIALENSISSIGGWGSERVQDDYVLTRVVGRENSPSYLSLLAVFSFHRNGYVRHGAVRRLALSTDGFVLPFLMLRSNDWVQPIADDARESLEKRFDALTPEQRQVVLPLLGYLNRCERRQFAALIESVLRNFLVPSRHDDAVATLNMNARGIGRTFADIVFIVSGEHQARLLPAGISSRVATVRIIFTKRMPGLLDQQEIASNCRRLQRDPVMAVRREAYRVEAQSRPADAAEIWKRAMFDVSYALRDLARFERARLGISEHAACYSEAIQEHPDDYEALLGLADTAREEDAELLRRYLTHDFPSRRVHAVRGIGRALGEGAARDLLPRLNDDNRKVLRRVTAFLLLYPYLIDGEALLDLARSAVSLNARLNTISVAATCFAKWDSIVWLIRCAEIDDPIVSRRADQSIVSRLTCNRNFTKPSRENIETIERIVPDAQFLTPETKSLLLSTLRLVT